MQPAFEHILKQLRDARTAATMETMVIGFQHERIEIKATHFPDKGMEDGTLHHPTDYVKKVTENYRRSWIINPLDSVIELLDTYRELIERAERLAKVLDDAEIGRIQKLARASVKETEGY